jgi:hypothetical protein
MPEVKISRDEDKTLPLVLQDWYIVVTLSRVAGGIFKFMKNKGLER